MTQHRTKIEKRKIGVVETYQPKCSCGWESRNLWVSELRAEQEATDHVVTITRSED